MIAAALLLLLVGSGTFAVASSPKHPTSFCGFDGPACTGEPLPCSTEYFYCEGPCRWEGTFLFGRCIGPEPCESLTDQPERCKIIGTGCQYHDDPPCELDPFDVAITPFHLDRFCACAGFPYCSSPLVVICDKVKPSIDGRVVVTETTQGLGSSCSMSVNGKKCQSCSPCNHETRVSFDCSNVLTKSASAIGDHRCPGGKRCVGRDCNDNCICAGGGPKCKEINARGCSKTRKCCANKNLKCMRGRCCGNVGYTGCNSMTRKCCPGLVCQQKRIRRKWVGVCSKKSPKSKACLKKSARCGKKKKPCCGKLKCTKKKGTPRCRKS